VRFSPSTKSVTFQSVGCWLWSHVACQLHARSRYSHWRWPDNAYPSHSDMFKVFCCPQQLRSIRQSVSNDMMRLLIVALVFSRLDYGSATLAGLPKQFMNAAAWLIFKACRQITLASDARMYFVPAGNAGVSLPPRLCTWLPGLRSSAHVTPQRMSTTALFDCISAWLFHALCVLPLATAPFQRQLHQYGTVCQSQSGHRCRCKFSVADWKPNFLPSFTVMTNNVSLHWLLLCDFTV